MYAQHPGQDGGQSMSAKAVGRRRYGQWVLQVSGREPKWGAGARGRPHPTSARRSLPVSWGCRNNTHWVISPPEMYSSWVLEAGSPEPRWEQGWFIPGLSWPLGFAGGPWWPLACGRITRSLPLFSHRVCPVCVSVQMPSLDKGTCHWIRAHSSPI